MVFRTWASMADGYFVVVQASATLADGHFFKLSARLLRFHPSCRLNRDGLTPESGVVAVAFRWLLG
jgi:hypothetical protein